MVSPVQRVSCWIVGLSLVVVAAWGGAGERVAPKKHVRATRLVGKLTLDGKLDEAAWQAVPLHTGFAMPLGLANRTPIPREAQTAFRVLYDDEVIYFGIRCNEPKMADLVAKAARKHDAAMWSDDDIELFLDPVGDRAEYYQLTINSEGTTVDLYYIESGNTQKAGWSSEWRAAAHRGADFWSVEVAVPFAVFHNRPSKAWAEKWGFSMSRTRKPKPAYYSQFSPAGGYHDVANFGTLGPIQIDRSRYNLYAESPTFRLEPAQDGYAVAASLQIENRGDTPFDGTLEMEVLAPKAKGASAALRLAPRSSTRVALAGSVVRDEGKWPVVFRARATKGYTALACRLDEWLTYTPLIIRITAPNYRNAIYATQQVDTVRGEVAVGLPMDKARGLTLRVSLSSRVHEPLSTEAKVASDTVPFGLPAADLPVGRYTVRAELLRPVGKPVRGKQSTQLVAETETILRKLAPAPSVEARVDDQGNLLINGQPIFIRGWYGSMGYVVSAASFPQAQLPRSTNFVMGGSDRERTDLGLYTIVGVTRLLDEAKAKLDQPIDSELKAKLRAVIARTRAQRNVIGYYISDEPECRGLSPTFLRSLYQFMADEDPYRFCKIVSRAPDVYINACDVMCPHPYMNPQVLPDGSRRFGNYFQRLSSILTTAVKANDGSKAVWAMPQTFSYGGLHGTDPTFRESRWFTHTALACGVKGIVPFIFNGYWNHYESRVGMSHVFEELTFLAPAWMGRDTATDVLCDKADVLAVAKHYKRPRGVHAHTFLVAANQSYGSTKATFTVPVLAKRKTTRLLVLRENRTVAVENGRFTDEFGGLGVHVYTTLEVLPHLRTLADIEADIARQLARPKQEGNILASGKVRWAIGKFGRRFASDRDLADGVRDAAGWFPVYGDRKQCLIVFAKPVAFSRVVLHTPTMRDAALDVWVGGQWKTVHEWKDEFLYRLEYKGAKMTTDRIRIRPTKARRGYGSWLVHEITELGIYE